MLTLEGVSLRLGEGDDAPRLLSHVSCSFLRGEFVAILGPSGCGKSTFLKLIAGIAPGEESGVVRWDGRNLAEEDFHPSEFGYVPQFGIAHEELTAAECVSYSARLRVSGLDPEERGELVRSLLERTGMSGFAESRVSVLSGGQRRRLALAMELVSSPPILLCDEVTSGLDPRSEGEIVELLRGVASEGNRLVLSVTHSVKDLALHSTVVVLHGGVLAYAGPPSLLCHYFRIETPEEVYSRLEEREPGEWEASWRKHGEAFLSSRGGGSAEGIPCPECGHSVETISGYCRGCGASRVLESGDPSPAPIAPPVSPGASSQFMTLVERRFLIFFRNPAQLWLQAGLILGFPLLVAVFGWNGLPQIRNLGMDLNLDVVRQLTEARDFLLQASRVGSLVSGIVMFEVILLTLMGANNSGREIAGERGILEKEKLSGLNPSAYVGSKILFLGVLCTVQSLWMGFFVRQVCSFPGEAAPQFLFLFLVDAAMTSLCLAISSLLATAEQASLASIYLVGFQLPLSGAVLALPGRLDSIVHPFISAYWSWSGILQSLRGDRYYDIAVTVVQTGLAATPLCLWMLSVHILAGLLLALRGTTATRIS
jgi:ABC-type multidrug transport system ATPase subunit